ncbi:glycosyltransferase family 4 protein [Loktanella sp. SALINAS62]|uniref:glycosyltransferase family 4 protein n=1 Tax=Loktanella sp. SALINAS62 TaxID=2706124 RepID=UPI001B8BE8B1|nr:glycosyltransferase family 4 protein [Loktanella sp. SALINAS62]MBS1301863.1 glycosyltransferase family 4 protein [Loktanella sp. SALINAS62]
MTGPAIFFHADAIESKGKELVGRRSAGQSFLRGFLQHVPGDTVHALVETPHAGKVFETVARDLGETRPVSSIALNSGADFSGPGTIFFPGPGYMQAAWQRQGLGMASCSLVGITHTVSTRRVMEGMHRLLSEPVQNWDAIICTSRAVHGVVQRQMTEERAFLLDRFGGTRVPMPQLPVIPLGIQADDFARRDGARQAMRARYDAGDGFVVMTMGRLTSVEKANPVPLYLALEQLAGALGRPVYLWQVGWASRDTEADLHRDAAAAFCPSVSVQQIDGRDPDVRRDIWAGADVFTLPADNIQETFGLVPVEAMAAGLPVVMPDWNGFRDTVIHGETGFLIPTRMTGPGHPQGRDLAARFADGRDSYLHHLSLIQQQTQIDVTAYAGALLALGRDADLCAQMGQAGVDHVRRTFDWSVVIPQYLALGEELAARRAAAKPRRPVMPLQIDPFDLYGGYPTAHPDGDWIMSGAKTLTLEQLNTLDRLNGRTLYNRKQLPDARVVAFADAVARVGIATVADIAQTVKMRLDLALAVALFLAKYDYLKLVPPEPQ